MTAGVPDGSSDDRRFTRPSSDAVAADLPLPDVLSAERLLSTPTIDVERARIRFADGHEAERIVVRHPGAVAIVALDEEGRWLLVRQYRHPAGSVLLEVPAGTLEPGEAPERAAARELREETGFAAAELERLGGFYTAPGFCDEYIHVFLARGRTRSRRTTTSTSRAPSRSPLPRSRVPPPPARSRMRRPSPRWR